MKDFEIIDKNPSETNDVDLCVHENIQVCIIDFYRIFHIAVFLRSSCHIDRLYQRDNLRISVNIVYNRLHPITSMFNIDNVSTIERISSSLLLLISASSKRAGILPSSVVQ
jgi:hypothetical protein